MEFQRSLNPNDNILPSFMWFCITLIRKSQLKNNCKQGYKDMVFFCIFVLNMDFLIWITGLAGSGKTTIGRSVFNEIKKTQSNTVFIDGDAFREIMGKNTGHSREERFVVAMQISRLCRFLVDQRINVVCSTISLFKEVHRHNRETIRNYFEVFIDCKMDELIRRDQKGIYTKALKGELTNVVGIDIPYDKPLHSDLVIDNTDKGKLAEKVVNILNLIKK